MSHLDDEKIAKRKKNAKHILHSIFNGYSKLLLRCTKTFFFQFDAHGLNIILLSLEIRNR